jgi:hypothetical protein
MLYRLTFPVSGVTALSRLAIPRVLTRRLRLPRQKNLSSALGDLKTTWYYSTSMWEKREKKVKIPQK